MGKKNQKISVKFCYIDAVILKRYLGKLNLGVFKNYITQILPLVDPPYLTHLSLSDHSPLYHFLLLSHICMGVIPYKLWNIYMRLMRINILL